METGKLIYTIKQDAIGKGLCRLWQRKLKNGLSYKELAEMYIKGIDFCISENFPTIDFLEENFKGKCEEYGVFVNDQNVVCSNFSDIVLNGDCRAVLDYSGYTVSRLFARHNTKATINVFNNAIVTIDAFDKSELVVAVSGENAQVLVNLYGDAQVECIGVGIKVRYMNKQTY